MEIVTNIYWKGDEVSKKTSQKNIQKSCGRRVVEMGNKEEMINEIQQQLETLEEKYAEVGLEKKYMIQHLFNKFLLGVQGKTITEARKELYELLSDKKVDGGIAIHLRAEFDEYVNEKINIPIQIVNL